MQPGKRGTWPRSKTLQGRNGSGYTQLQSLSSSQQAIFNTYNRPPYVRSAGSIQFVDVGGKYVLSGATYDPGPLSGESWSQIAAQFANPTTAEAKAIDGSANLLTAAICQMTNQQPASVCSGAPRAQHSAPADFTTHDLPLTRAGGRGT